MESSSLPPPPPPLPPGDTSAILLSLVHLPAHRLASLRRAASLDLRVLRQRLAGLLLSPALFSLALSRVRSLPLSSKSSLLARLLLAPLHRFASASDPLLPPSPSRLPPRDLDAAVLLLAMCDSIHPRDDDAPAPLSKDDWRRRIAWRLSTSSLSTSGLGPEAGFGECVEMAAKCGRLLAAEGEGEGGKEGRSAAAAVEAVLRLEEVAAGWCAVCREQTAAVACGMPCGYRFHWSCILPWLQRRNTCPCCRFELPGDDVFCEVRRLWRAVTAAGRSQRSQPIDCSRRRTGM